MSRAPGADGSGNDPKQWREQGEGAGQSDVRFQSLACLVVGGLLRDIV